MAQALYTYIANDNDIESTRAPHIATMYLYKFNQFVNEYNLKFKDSSGVVRIMKDSNNLDCKFVVFNP